ncbi:MAG: hypothetical protein BWY95_02249 [Bacteroidetes bacterium ADurb.BinA104]|nr:MAG: hypothetical protein BWY95_02249 [Bacteroidetes bacterium ADurb.BinA104]
MSCVPRSEESAVVHKHVFGSIEVLDEVNVVSFILIDIVVERPFGESKFEYPDIVITFPDVRESNYAIGRSYCEIGGIGILSIGKFYYSTFGASA